MRAVICVVALAISETMAFGQRGPAFDTASVRQSLDGTTPRTLRVTPTGIDFTSVSLLNCVEEAFGVTPFQIMGPAWIRTERYDITARTGAPTTRSEMMTRLQTLLTDRFMLKLRREQRPLRVFALAVSRNGPRLTNASGDGEARREAAGGAALAFRNSSMRDLAAYLARQGPVGVPVVDETNLAGRFDFVLTFARGSANVNVRKTLEEGGPTAYMDAVADLGLRLESRTRPLDVIEIIDGERVPTSN